MHDAGSKVVIRLPGAYPEPIKDSHQSVIKIILFQYFNGEPGWDRTNDHLIKSQISTTLGS